MQQDEPKAYSRLRTAEAKTRAALAPQHELAT
jgi:hypothetical protein